jgi:hypothetical protein
MRRRTALTRRFARYTGGTIRVLNPQRAGTSENKTTCSPLAVSMNTVHPDRDWKQHWKVGILPPREAELTDAILNIFCDFWKDECIDELSKTSQRRYSGALHALGSYLIEKSVEEDNEDMSLENLLDDAITPDEGPLIYHENESWQKEVDAVSRKLYKHLKSKCKQCGRPHRDRVSS